MYPTLPDYRRCGELGIVPEIRASHGRGVDYLVLPAATQTRSNYGLRYGIATLDEGANRGRVVGYQSFWDSKSDLFRPGELAKLVFSPTRRRGAIHPLPRGGVQDTHKKAARLPLRKGLLI
jgi:hypothetical protein